jgi:uncharacterized protein YndB with AHSA1/START domain
MPDILHRVGIASTASKVYKALTTLDGLSHWWITGTTGNTRPGDTIHFMPDGGGFDMKVVESNWVERGQSHAHPYDVKIHVGD